MALSEQHPVLKKLARGGASSLFVKVASAALSFIMFVVIARGMTTEDFSLFGFGFSAATLMVLIGSLGQRMAALRFIPIYIDKFDQAGLFGFVSRGYKLVFFGCFGTTLLFVIASYGLSSLTSGFYCWAVAIFTISLGIAEYQSHVLRGHGTMLLALLPREVLWRAMVSIFFLLPAVSLIPLVPASWAFLIISAMLLALTLGQATMHSTTKLTSLLKSEKDIKDVEVWDRSSRIFWGTSVLRAATPNAAMILATLLLDAEESGAFFAALRLAMVVNLFLIAANMLSMPMLSSAHGRSDRYEILAICRFVTISTSIPAGIFFMVFCLMGDTLLGFYGNEFSFANGALLIIAAGHLSKVLSGPGQAILQMMGQEGQFLRISLWVNGVTLLLLIPAVWMFGIYGAAFATGAELLSIGVIGAWFCYRNLGIDPSILSALRGYGRDAA